MSYDAAISSQFDLPGVGSVSVLGSGLVDAGQDSLASDITAATGADDLGGTLTAMAYAAQSRTGLTKMHTPTAYAVRDGAGWRVDIPAAGVWFTCDYMFTYASVSLNVYTVLPAYVTDFVSASATTPPFWKELVGTLEDGAGSTAASGSWTP